MSRALITIIKAAGPLIAANPELARLAIEALQQADTNAVLATAMAEGTQSTTH